MTVLAVTVLAGRIVAVLVALGVIVITPLVGETSSGRTYDLFGVVVDLAALAIIVAVVWNARPRRSR